MLRDHIAKTDFPCVGAKAAMARGTLEILGARDIASAWDDLRIHDCLRRFAEHYRAEPQLFRSLAVVFAGPDTLDEAAFERADVAVIGASPEGDRLAVVATKPRTELLVLDPATGRELHAIAIPAHAPWQTRNLTFLGKDALLATDGPAVQVFDLAGGKPLLRQDAAMNTFAATADGRLLAVLSGGGAVPFSPVPTPIETATAATTPTGSTPAATTGRRSADASTTLAYTGGQVTFPFVPLGIALIAAGVVALFLIRRRRQSADDRR